MNKKNLIQKSQSVATIRQFFLTLGYQEIHVPILHLSVPQEPCIYPFQTKGGSAIKPKTFYLPTSPESHLKKCLATGITRCFAVSPSFRNLENTSAYHNPEFLMLEWYGEGNDLEKLMTETQSLIRCVAQSAGLHNSQINSLNPWKQKSIQMLFKEFIGVEIEQVIDDRNMMQLASSFGYSTKNATWEQLFNQLFLNKIEPFLGVDPCFVTGYPSKISPLCKKRLDLPFLAERFELYIHGIEIANGNMENTDKKYVKNIFLKERNKRERLGIHTPPIDTDFINALSYLKGKGVGGVGLGVERLIGIVSDTRPHFI